MSPQPGSSQPPSRRITQLGDFRLGPKLGSGAMGTVYRARHIDKDRDVAVKVMRRALAKNPIFVERFKREATLMAKLRHPNLVRCYHAGKQFGRYYLAMELVEGYSLYQWRAHLGKLSPADAVHVALAVAEALRHAHDNGLIHRDVKPENVLIGNDGQIKLVDLGLAKGFDQDELSLTQTGRGAGTPVYIAPEQARNARDADVRSDLYALGCTFYRILTGVLPFDGENSLEVVLNKIEGEFVPPSERSPEIPAKINAVTARLLAPEPVDRYQSAPELIAALHKLGLASRRLTFLDRQSTDVLGEPFFSTFPDSGRSHNPTVSGSETDGEAKVLQWYVVFQDARGKWLQDKMSFENLKTRLIEERFRVTARASLQPGDYRPLEAYSQLRPLLRRAQEAQNEAARKSKPLSQQCHAIKQKRNARPPLRSIWKWYRFPLLLLIASLLCMGVVGYWLILLLRT